MKFKKLVISLFMVFVTVFLVACTGEDSSSGSGAGASTKTVTLNTSNAEDYINTPEVSYTINATTHTVDFKIKITFKSNVKSIVSPLTLRYNYEFKIKRSSGIILIQSGAFTKPNIQSVHTIIFPDNHIYNQSDPPTSIITNVYISSAEGSIEIDNSGPSDGVSSETSITLTKSNVSDYIDGPYIGNFSYINRKLSVPVDLILTSDVKSIKQNITIIYSLRLGIIEYIEKNGNAYSQYNEYNQQITISIPQSSTIGSKNFVKTYSLASGVTDIWGVDLISFTISSVSGVITI